MTGLATASPDAEAPHGPRPMLRLRDVARHYGAVRAVDGVDLEIFPGEIFGLIGHNGAGKSTLFKMMLGLVRPTRGEILVDGVAVGSKDFRATRRRLGYLPENLALYDNLDGLEVLRFFARLKGAPPAHCREAIERVGLAAAAHRPLREYSKGMRQRLGLAQALLGAPRVLFLDEPTNGLDPQAINDFYQTLQALRENGVTIILTSHILAELQERVDRLAILANGKVQAIGSVARLREQTGIPLLVEIDLAPADIPALASALAALDLPVDRGAKGVRLRCAQGRKLDVLAAVMPWRERILDLRLIEASLEDVFFGLKE